jgi:predicted nucleic acid-binding protein
MRRILVDTNVLVSFLTDRNVRQREKAALLLRGAAENEHTLVLHSMAIVEMIYVLTQLYDDPPETVAEDVSDLLAMPGVLSVDEVSWTLVMDRWPRTISSIGDAILAAVAVHGGFDAVATFDRDLARKLIRQGSALVWPARS